MFLKKWPVIIVLAVVGVVLGMYWMSISSAPDGVVPQGDEDDMLGAVAVLAGAITTVGGAVFGVLGKYTDYKKARLEIAAKELELEERRRAKEAS